jgi:hypothetical protein
VKSGGDRKRDHVPDGLLELRDQKTGNGHRIDLRVIEKRIEWSPEHLEPDRGAATGDLHKVQELLELQAHVPELRPYCGAKFATCGRR